MSENIKVAIADDHKLFREGLAVMVNSFKDIAVIIKAGNGKDLLSQLNGVKPDVVLMDLQMPVMSGIEATKSMRKRYPEIKIIGLSVIDKKKFIIEMIKAGAHGYLFKNSEPDELEKAIRMVTTNDFYFNDYMTEALYKGWQNKKRVNIDLNRLVKLTRREGQILQYICAQKTNNLIRLKLGLSIRTVENYRRALIEKAGVKNTAGLVMFAIVNGLVKMDLSLKI